MILGKSKMRILYAYTVQVIEFKDWDAAEEYLRRIHTAYEVESVKPNADDTGIVVRIRKQYNNNPMEGGTE